MICPRDTILFQGDSITNAFRRPEEINNAFQLGAGYALLIAARLLLDRPADQLTFLNRGVSGDTVQKLAHLHDRHRLECTHGKKVLVTTHDDVSSAFDGTLQNPVIVGIVFDGVNGFGWGHNIGDRLQLLPNGAYVSRGDFELCEKFALQLVEDGRRNY